MKHIGEIAGEIMDGLDAWFDYEREEEMKPRIYIAGPMTGLPEYNFPAFNKAARDWREAGWEVLNPAESFNGDTTLPYWEYVKHDIELIRTCDAIALLAGWDGPTARGSCWERGIAEMVLGLTVYEADRPVEGEGSDMLYRIADPETVLQEAQRLVHGDRGASYGHPIDDYTATGRIWGALLDRWLASEGITLEQDGETVAFPDIDPRVAALMMVGVKVSREAHKHKRDNLTDTAGYAECTNMIAERQAA